MRELTAIGLNVATSARASFADVRIVSERVSRVYVERRSLKRLEASETLGAAVRVLLDGAWGFASTTRVDADGLAAAARHAVATAKASAAVPKDVPARMVTEPAAVETQAGPCREDPFEVPAREKADLLLAACDTMLNVPDVVMAWGAVECSRVRRVIANTDGSFLDLTNTFANPALGAVAVVGSESQSRGYQGGGRQAGYEFIREADLPGRARGWAEEAVLKCRAEDSPQGTMDLVLDPMNLALTMHESVGHPTELDRILGWEANMAGRSFVQPEHVGSLRYGSEHVNFSVNGSLAGGLASWFFDDDGVRMQAYPLIRNGVLVGLNTTRETAAVVGWSRSSGCCRASGFANIPINRIPNLFLEPGPDNAVTPDTLIAGIDHGVWIEGLGSFSIDQMRNNFQFGGDMFWLIENGRRTRPLKKVTYQAQTRAFWQSCDGVAGPSSWQPHGIMNCGKGEPMQIQRMTHGASAARFRGIQVGGARL